MIAFYPCSKIHFLRKKELMIIVPNSCYNKKLAVLPQEMA